MQNSLYTFTVPVFIKNLKNLSGIIDKSVLHAEGVGEGSKKFDANVLLTSRLAPDQFPFVKQVQLASDTAKAFAARLNGQDPVSMPDTENTMEELKARIDATIAVLESVKPEDVNGKEDSQVTIKWFPGKFITGFDYATEYALPNFFFHVTTAYAILRHNGVNLGKTDFLGGLPLQDMA
jgi:hypothetical protein